MNESAAKRLARVWSGNVGRLTLLRFSLLWLAVSSLGFGLAAMVKYLQISSVFWTGFFAVLLGWLLGRSRLSGDRSGLLAAGTGLLWVFLVAGRLFKPLGGLFSTLSALLVQINSQRTPFTSLDANSLIEAWEGLAASLTTLFSRMGNWYRGLSGGNAVIDPVVTGLLWAALVWIAAVWAGWFVRRKGSAFVGLLPGCALLAYNAFYANSRSGLFWLILLGGVMVLLQAANGYLSAEQRWQTAQMHRAHLEPTLAAAVLGITFALMLVGGVSPSLSIQDIKNSVNRLMEARQDQQLAKALSLQLTPGSGTGSNVSVGVPALSAQHRVGPGPIVLHDVVMYATIQGYQPVPPAILQQVSVQASAISYQYWRGQTYETYTGYGWSATTADEADYPADAAILQIPEPLPENYRIIHQHIQRATEKSSALFVIGDLVSADQPFHVNWRQSDDLISARTESATYDAESRTPYATVDQLRSAGTDYPVEIRNRYLQLPSNLPQRVRGLALDLTAPQPTPYDQAAAIEAYLRTLPYSLEVPAPPITRDVADFFLFDLKTGYCDYYATTMAVLARAAGIPSRMVIGYASGQYDYQSGHYVITLADSHAWVQIYFPGYGWVDFEPTAGLPPLQRLGSQATVSAASASSTPGIASQAAASSPRMSPNTWLPYLFGLLAVVLAAVLLFLFLPVERWTLLARPVRAAVTSIFQRLYRQGLRWGIEADASRTPHEFATALTSQLEKIDRNERLASALSAPIVADLNWLTGLYTRLLFSPLPPTRAEHLQAVDTWKRLRQKLSQLRRRRPHN